MRLLPLLVPLLFFGPARPTPPTTSKSAKNATPVQPVAPTAKLPRHLEVPLPTQAAVPAELTPLTFYKDVLPVFRANCGNCHLGDKKEGGLALDDPAVLLRVGAKGALVVPGKSAESPLIQRLDGTLKPQMPLPAQPGATPRPLAAAVIERLKKWIADGAKLGLEGRTAATLEITAKIGPLPAAAALAFSDDGKLLAVGQFGKVVLWDVAAGKVLRTLTEVAGHVHALQFSPDGKLLAAGGGVPGRMGEVKLFNTADWSTAQTLKEHLDVVFDLSFSKDGARLLTAGLDKTARVWTVAEGKVVFTIKDHSDVVNGCVFAPDGNFYTASSDRTVRLFNGQTGKSFRTFIGHTLPVLALAVSPDGASVLSTGEEPALRWWNVQQGNTLRNQGGHGVACHEAKFSKDGRFVVSAGADNSVRIWNGQTGGALRTLTGASDWLYSVAITADNRLVAGGTADGRVLMWDQASGRMLATLVSHPAKTSADWLATTPAGWFDTSDAMRKLITFKVAGEVVPSEPFATLQKPDLLAKSLSGQPVDFARIAAPMPPKS